MEREEKSKMANEVATNITAGSIPYADVRRKIICIRNRPVLIDADVAELYGVETKRVNEAVRNNPDKFPSDYMFELNSEESRVLRSNFSTLEQEGKGKHTKYNYKAFTEKGLYMLATVLKSRQATEGNAKMANVNLLMIAVAVPPNAISCVSNCTWNDMGGEHGKRRKIKNS